MTSAKPLKKCSPAEIQSFVAIVRLAADLKEKGVFCEDDGHEPVEDMIDAIYRTINLVYFASDIIEDHGEEANGSN